MNVMDFKDWSFEDICVTKFITNKMRKNIDQSFAREGNWPHFRQRMHFYGRSPDPNLSETPCTHSVPNNLRRLSSIPSPSEGDSIKTDLRAGFMKTVRFSGSISPMANPFFLTCGPSIFFSSLFLFLVRANHPRYLSSRCVVAEIVTVDALRDHDTPFYGHMFDAMPAVMLDRFN